MTPCIHLWLPTRSLLWRTVTCANCDETRRVRLRWRQPVPVANVDALREAIDCGVIANEEVTWGGQRLR